MSALKVALLVCLLAVATGVTIFLAVFLGTRPSTPPSAAPPPVSFASRNYATNPGFEDADPANAFKAEGWAGDYSLHSYALTRKRAVFANLWPLVSNASLYFPAGNNAIRTTIPPSSANETTYSIISTSQTVNIGQLLRDSNPSQVELQSVTGIFVSVWCSTIYAPRSINNETAARNSAVNGTIPGITLLSTARDSNGQQIGAPISMTKRLSALSPWHWQQHSMLLPINTTNLATLNVILSSTIIGDVFWDNVGVYFAVSQSPSG